MTSAQLRGPYFSEDGRPLLRRSAVAYLDELGVTELLRDFDQSKLERWSTQIDSLKRHIREPLGSLAVTAAFSDNFVTCVPLDGSKFLPALEVAVLVATYQCKLAVSGRVSRGALVVGEIFAGGDRVIGPALVVAHDIEDKLAIYPRVVVDDTYLEAVTAELSEQSAESQRSLGSQFVSDPDGKVFVNYLMDVHCYIDREDTFRDVSAHRDVIANGLQNKQARVRAKYVWLAQYHNWFCGKYFPERRLEVSAGLTTWELKLPRQFDDLAETLASED